jgi:hypothetical protein
MHRDRVITYITLLSFLTSSVFPLFSSPAQAQTITPTPSTGPSSPSPGPEKPPGARPEGSLDDFQIPEQPTAPPALAKRVPPKRFTCQRQFLYQGKLLELDSNLYTDAEHLRPIVNDVPPALASLNRYQQGRRNVRILAYTGSLGLLMLVGSYLLSRQQDSKTTGRKIRQIGMGSGLLIASGSLVWGLSVMATNEHHLQDSVNRYNEARPNDLIELQFSTGFRF